MPFSTVSLSFLKILPHSFKWWEVLLSVLILEGFERSLFPQGRFHIRYVFACVAVFLKKKSLLPLSLLFCISKILMPFVFPMYPIFWSLMAWAGSFCTERFYLPWQIITGQPSTKCRGRWPPVSQAQCFSGWILYDPGLSSHLNPDYHSNPKFLSLMFFHIYFKLSSF